MLIRKELLHPTPLLDFACYVDFAPFSETIDGVTFTSCKACKGKGYPGKMIADHCLHSLQCRRFKCASLYSNPIHPCPSELFFPMYLSPFFLSTTFVIGTSHVPEGSVTVAPWSTHTHAYANSGCSDLTPKGVLTIMGAIAAAFSLSGLMLLLGAKKL